MTRGIMPFVKMYDMYQENNKRGKKKRQEKEERHDRFGNLLLLYHGREIENPRLL